MAHEVLSEPHQVAEEGVDRGREADTLIGLVSECCLFKTGCRKPCSGPSAGRDRWTYRWKFWRNYRRSLRELPGTACLGRVQRSARNQSIKGEQATLA
jgi:Ni,Fe-hydrogenase I small subunit